MSTVKVENMKSPKGNNVPNQFIIQTSDGLYFQSYHTIIAFKPLSGKIQLDKNAWDYSATTGKYRNLFLCENKKETQRCIKNGTYELTDLNCHSLAGFIFDDF